MATSPYDLRWDVQVYPKARAVSLSRTNYLREEDASLLLPLQTWQLSYFKKVVSLCRIPLDGFQELPYAYKAIRFIANGVTDDLLSSWLIILGNIGYIGTYRKKAQETVTKV